MGSLFNSIGATIVASILILTIVVAIFNTRLHGNDASTYLMLNAKSERIVSALQNNYLANLGAGLSDSLAVNIATATTFEFKRKEKQAQVNADVVKITQGIKNKQGYPIEVYVNNNLDMGPFYMEYPLIIEYFRFDDKKIKTPADSLSYIRSCSFSLSFKAQAQQENKIIVSKLKFWKYFKNLYF